MFAKSVDAFRNTIVGLTGFIILAILSAADRAEAATAPPQSFIYQGRLFQNDGTTPLTDIVSFKTEIYDPSGLCLLYSQQTLNYNLAPTNGLFSLSVGAPTGDTKRAPGDPNLSMTDVFANNYNHTARPGCGSFDPATMSTTARRKLKVTVTNITQGSTVLVLSPMQSLEASPYATVAETVQGYGPDKLVKIQATTTQVAIDNLTAQSTPLLNLAAQATPLTSLAAQSTKLLSLAASYSGGGYLTIAPPVTGTDAVNKNYSDARLGGLTLDVTTTAPTTTGQSIRWNATSSKWEVYTPAGGGGGSGLPTTGGTMTGPIAMGTSKITGLGNPTLAQDAATKNYCDANVAGTAYAQSGLATGDVMYKSAMGWINSPLTTLVQATTITTGQLSGTVGVANGGTGINGSTAADGELLIGNGAGFTKATLTAGTNVTITNAAGAITINASGGGPVGTNAGYGVNALANNTGTNNTAVGNGAMQTNVAKRDSTAVGYQSMYYANSSAVASAVNNTALGALSLRGSATAASNTGTSNTAIGHSAMMSTTSGSNNTAVGYSSLTLNTSGSSNVAIGVSPLSSNTSGMQNVAMGNASLYYNSTGNSNVALGHRALFDNLTGNSNVATGDGAVDSNTTGSQNVATGANAMSDNTTGGKNVAIGESALRYNVAKNESTSVGFSSMHNTDSSAASATTYNTAVGAYSLRGSATPSANTGTYNTSLGHSSMLVNSSGAYNTAVGADALGGNTTGGLNVAIGYSAGSAITTGSNNVVIGGSTGSTIATLSDNMILSTGNGTQRMFIDSTGNAAIGTSTTPLAKLDVAGQIRAPSVDAVASGAIDFAGGNAVTTSFDCGSNVTFANLNDGGSYTLAVTGTGTTQCTFSTTTTGNGAGTVSYRFKPTNGVRTATSHTIYSLQRIGNVVYVGWSSGW